MLPIKIFEPEKIWSTFEKVGNPSWYEVILMKIKQSDSAYQRTVL